MKKEIKSGQKKKFLGAVGISLIILIIFILVYTNYQVRTGQAILIGSTPWAGGEINLTTEGSITFNVLPTSPVELRIITSLFPEDLVGTHYLFNLNKSNDNTYLFYVSEAVAGVAGKIIAQDILTIAGADDSSLIYLNNRDTLPDLEVSYHNNKIKILNMHTRSVESAVINLQNSDGTIYPRVIPLVLSEDFIAVINASSISAPTNIAANLGEVFGMRSFALKKFSTAGFKYNPVTIGPKILIVNATVMGKSISDYFTLAVNGQAYNLREDKFPQMTLNFKEDETLQLNISFVETTELQPLALPCEISAHLSTLLAGTNVKRIYSYKDGAPIVWTKDAGKDFNTLDLFQGYFVELASATHTHLNVSCVIHSPLPAYYSGSIRIKFLPRGWNLISLPGTIARPLTQFITRPDLIFRLYECSQNYECVEISSTSHLIPGKTYAISSDDSITLAYVNSP